MKKVLVIYYSRTGNTEKMAKMIAEGLVQKGIVVDLKNVNEVDIDSLPDYDGYIIGSPNYFGTMVAEIKKFIDESVKYYRKIDGKLVAAFSSTGMIGGGGETVCLDILKSFLVHGCLCLGFTRLGHYGPVAIGKPDERIEREINEMVNKYSEILNKI
ncbi:MAG TPA: flavodoxin domain-containing protein [Thermodesulfovibrio thiophilus]|uniref:flavodoxin family protein n=1 Tax=Thermodesulfovibrio thiophilus TaxID=340095 RepID=UPI00040EFF1F|nr:flavodoxin domain-containing protein [Thermodesulfovibrio thiophilus]HHW19843.1 flavodoxin family protein [Thermodesulfovibrio thiophilus]HOA82558.1 flavodoxin domain-containing protein [Thermodesulfovibrio thiophilus]HQA03188.1 flavodoxin domain-containing protein [Thermodesulfovibrio thiophilus]HQD35550.1 flavodoxin domain-containing protein [Thermodesulfovibrio thiophilus]